MFQVNIAYLETDLTMAEALRYARAKFGNNAIVTFAPTSSDSESIIDFMLESTITQEQIDARFSNHKELYERKVALIKQELLDKVSSRMDKVIRSNEDRL